MKLFVFGSTGDLIKKKVLPALEEIKSLELIMIGRKDLDNFEFKEKYCKECSSYLKERINYKRIDFSDIFYKKIENLLDKNSKNYFYISLPPNLIYQVLKEIIILKQSGYQVQILIEKPFGESLIQAKELEDFIQTKKVNEDIYLADHYLFKEEVLNLNFNKKIKELEIKSIEKEGINSRAYYDDVGAIKDMVQSHLLNILFKILNRKKDNLGFKIDKIKIGQYRDYESELGKKSKRETYVKIDGEIIENNKKDRIKVILETGKKRNKKEISLRINEKYIIIKDKINPYITMFNYFLLERRENFPSISQSLSAWKITEQILEYIKKEEIILDKY